MAVIHITKENFEKEVLRSSEPVLLDFWAPWCGPCRMVSPIVDQVSNEVDAKVCKINIDEQQELASSFNVMSIPTLMVMQDGEIVDSSVGFRGKEQIKQMLAQSR
ncbi:MAG: thioredoxin [Massilioclostridium sp.]|nr:thioredoxin [Massilioclostridium sp.]MEE1490765.1 thioredoxin [Massilioclostridium sp.]